MSRRSNGRPRGGMSWEGFVIENLIATESLAHPASRFWFHRTHSGSEVDLVVDRGERRIGFEVKLAAAVGVREAAGLAQARSDGVIHEGVLLYHGEREFALGEGIRAMPVDPVLRGGAAGMRFRGSAVWRFNGL